MIHHDPPPLKLWRTRARRTRRTTRCLDGLGMTDSGCSLGELREIIVDAGVDEGVGFRGQFIAVPIERGGGATGNADLFFPRPPVVGRAGGVGAERITEREPVRVLRPHVRTKFVDGEQVPTGADREIAADGDFQTGRFAVRRWRLSCVRYRRA